MLGLCAAMRGMQVPAALQSAAEAGQDVVKLRLQRAFLEQYSTEEHKVGGWVGEMVSFVRLGSTWGSLGPGCPACPAAPGLAPRHLDPRRTALCWLPMGRHWLCAAHCWPIIPCVLSNTLMPAAWTCCATPQAACQMRAALNKPGTNLACAGEAEGRS